MKEIAASSRVLLSQMDRKMQLATRQIGKARTGVEQWILNGEGHARKQALEALQKARVHARALLDAVEQLGSRIEHAENGSMGADMPGKHASNGNGSEKPKRDAGIRQVQREAKLKAQRLAVAGLHTRVRGHLRVRNARAQGQRDHGKKA